MNHKAIYALYPNVVSVDDSTGAFDAQGNKVTLDTQAINEWVNPEAYKAQRSAAYPSITDQLDLLYHGGLDAWKTVIKAVKIKYPKV
jgi:hypothetical protein